MSPLRATLATTSGPITYRYMTVHVSVTCEQVWACDNTNNNAPQAYQHEERSRTVKRTSQLERAVNDLQVNHNSRVKINATGSWTLVTAAAEVEHSEARSKLETRLTEFQSQTEEARETNVTRQYQVAANASKVVWRTTYSSDYFSWDTFDFGNPGVPPQPVIHFDVVVRVPVVSMLSAIRVHAVDQVSQRPMNSIAANDGRSSDMNSGCGGKYVYCVPEWTTNVDSAASSIEFVKTGSKNASLSDLAEGAGGDYRYITLTRGNDVITEIGLLRASDSEGEQEMTEAETQAGWRMTPDLNKGRNGSDYLYFKYKIARKLV